MSTIARHELLSVIGILLITCAVAIGNVRHNHEININRTMLELHSTAQEADMLKLKRKLDRITKQFHEHDTQ